MSDFDDLHRDGKDSTVMLDRLAASLGFSTEAFYNPDLTEEGQTLEFLRLWLTIEDGQVRAGMMALLRDMSAEARTSGEPMAIARVVHKPG